MLSIAASRDPVEQNPVHPSLEGAESDLSELEKQPSGLLVIYFELCCWERFVMHLGRSGVMQHSRQGGSRAVSLQEQEILHNANVLMQPHPAVRGY